MGVRIVHPEDEQPQGRARGDTAVSLEESNRNWQRLAEADPFWAVATHNRYHGGRHMDDFYATGQSDVESLASLILPLDTPPSLSQQSHVLDFGCGVGRLTFALAGWFGSVVGVDASQAMIEQAETQSWADWAPRGADIKFLHSTAQELPFSDGEFDLAVSLLVLQHLATPVALAYLAELCRVVRPSGWLAVQLPSHRTGGRVPPGTGGAPLPHPDGGPAGRMDMHGIAPDTVTDVLAACGVDTVSVVSDGRCGPTWESFLYVARKRAPVDPSGG